VADKIKGLIAVLAPEPICDDCIVERLGLSAPHQASQRTRELAGEGGFERRKDRCALCDEDKIVTRRNPR
jgi:hypothetical protein